MSDDVTNSPIGTLQAAPYPDLRHVGTGGAESTHIQAGFVGSHGAIDVEPRDPHRDISLPARGADP